jgi:ribonuclease P protein component
MIPRSLRLPKTRIGFLLKKGKKLANEFLVLKYRPTGLKKGESHFAVIISTKIEPKAVKRNRLRRQIYEIIRLNYDLLEIPADMIFIAKPGLAGQAHEQITKTITSFFKKIS